MQKRTQFDNWAYLILCDLHIQDNVIDEFRKSLPYCALKLIVIQQRVYEFKDTEDQVLKAKDFSCAERPEIWCLTL